MAERPHKRTRLDYRQVLIPISRAHPPSYFCILCREVLPKSSAYRHAYKQHRLQLQGGDRLRFLEQLLQQSDEEGWDNAADDYEGGTASRALPNAWVQDNACVPTRYMASGVHAPCMHAHGIQLQSPWFAPRR
jgi:hypothetical protein